MLNKFRERHAKRILWILAIVIIVAFGFSGVGFYLSGRDKNTLGKIGGKRITPNQLQYAMHLAQIQVILSADDSKTLSPFELERLGFDFLVLLWKTNQEKIEATNQEVRNYIIQKLFSARNFSQESYARFIENISRRYHLGLNARSFEEYIRSFVKIDKLFRKYTAVEIKPEEIKELYLHDTQKAKIAYLSIPYEKFKVEIGISPSDIENFYEKNKTFFQREAKITIAYTLIAKDNPKISDIVKSLPEIKTLKSLAEKFSLSVKEAGPLGVAEPIEDIGWQPEINQIAFALDKNTLSPPLETEKGILIIEKLKEDPQFVPALSDIENEVRDRLILERAKSEAQSFAQELLDKIKSQSLKDLKKIAGEEKISYQETGYFKFYDYIEGLGVDQQISEAVFGLGADEVAPQLFTKENAVFIVQLKSLTPFDEKDFREKKDTYQTFLAQNRKLLKYQEFLEKVRREANLALDSLP